MTAPVANPTRSPTRNPTPPPNTVVTSPTRFPTRNPTLLQTPLTGYPTKQVGDIRKVCTQIAHRSIFGEPSTESRQERLSYWIPTYEEIVNGMLKLVREKKYEVQKKPRAAGDLPEGVEKMTEVTLWVLAVEPRSAGDHSVADRHGVPRKQCEKMAYSRRIYNAEDYNTLVRTHAGHVLHIMARFATSVYYSYNSVKVRS